VEILILVVGMIALDVAAFLWGADSRDGVDSLEWQRRAAETRLGAVA
jgi:hypothetical protein